MKTDNKKSKDKTGTKAGNSEMKKGHATNRSDNAGANSGKGSSKKSGSQKENPNSQNANEKGFGEDE